MISKSTVSDPFLIDRRVRERNIHKKLLSQQEFEAYLKTLPDNEKDCEFIRVEEAEKV